MEMECVNSLIKDLHIHTLTHSIFTFHLTKFTPSQLFDFRRTL